MSKKGKHHNLIIAAIAREMAAYIWAIGKEVVLTPVNPKLRLSRVPAWVLVLSKRIRIRPRIVAQPTRAL